MIKNLIIVFMLCSSGYVSGQQNIIFSTFYKIFEVSNDGLTSKQLISSNEIIDIVDSRTKVYFSDKANEGIYEVDKISKITQRLPVEGYSPKGIWYVEETNELYYADDIKKGIFKYNLTSKSITEIISGINDAWEVCVNVKDNLIIWSEFNGQNIMKSDLKGNNRTIVKTKAHSVFQIEYNSLTKEIFYYQNGNVSTNSGIRKINIDGSNFKELVTNLSNGFSADFINNTLYMVVTFGELTSYDLNGTKIGIVGKYENVNSCYHSSYDTKIYYKSDNKEEAISEVNLSTKVASIYKLNDVYGAKGVIYDSLTQDIYYINSGQGFNNVKAGSIFKYNLETKTTTVILKDESVLAFPKDLDIDFEIQRIFWIDARYRTAFICNLDGSNPKKLYEGNLFDANTIQLDKKLKRVHIFGASDNEIFEYDYLGKKIYSYTIPDWSQSKDMVFDEKNKTYYICEEKSKKIRSLSRTTNIVSNVLTHNASIFAMEIVGPTLYFVDQNSFMFSLDLNKLTDPPVKIVDVKTLQAYNAYFLSKINYYKKVSTGTSITSDINTRSIEVYPNPSYGLIEISSDNQINEVDVFSVEGKLYNKQIKSNKDILDLSFLKNGIYFLNIRFINGERITRKIYIIK